MASTRLVLSLGFILLFLCSAGTLELELGGLVSLSSKEPADAALLGLNEVASVQLGEDHLLFAAMDFSADSVAFAVSKNGVLLCEGVDPSCIVRMGEENSKLTEMTGFLVVFLNYLEDVGEEKQAIVMFALPEYDAQPCDELRVYGDEEKNLNVLFVPDGFDEDDEEEFNAAAENAADALLSVEPFASNKRKFNFFKASFLLGASFECIESKGFECVKRIVPLVRACRRSVTVILSKYFEEEAEEAGKGYLEALAYPLTGFVVLPVSALESDASKDRAAHLAAHEFAHAFAGLGDEFFRDFSWFSAFWQGAFKKLPEQYERPNTLFVGCASWCSGELSEEGDCELFWERLLACQETSDRTCLGDVQSDFEERHAGEGGVLNYVSGCDLGADCVDGLGCFPGANYIFLEFFTPVPKGECIMSGHPARFCPVCMEELEKRLERFG